MNQETPSSKPTAKPWLSMGEDAANEDMLIGNRSGLLRLREAIDRALEKNEYFLPGVTGLCGVRVVSIKPEDQSSNPWTDRALTLGCMVTAVLCAGIFLFGCAELILKLSELTGCTRSSAPATFPKPHARP